jgi:hypothetical protein
MTRNNGDRGIRKLAIDHVKIGAAHATRQYLHEHIGWPGYGFIGLDRVDVAETKPGQRHRLHSDPRTTRDGSEKTLNRCEFFRISRAINGSRSERATAL